MKRTALIAGLWLLSSVLWSQTSTIEGLTDATTISESDKVWMVDVSAAGAARDVDATLEQIVSPFAADPSSNSSFDAAEWAADLAITSAWADITGTPTTLSGYGITDALTAAAVNGYFADPSTNGSFSASAWRTDLALGNMATISSGSFNTNLIPSIDGSFSLGDGSTRWANAYTTKTWAATIELGPSFNTDTTLSRVSAGVAAIEGVNILTTATGQPLDADLTSYAADPTAAVTAAGALMDSEVDADIKTLSLPASTTISAFGASVTNTADAAALRDVAGVPGYAVEQAQRIGLAKFRKAYYEMATSAGDKNLVMVGFGDSLATRVANRFGETVREAGNSPTQMHGGTETSYGQNTLSIATAEDGGATFTTSDWQYTAGGQYHTLDASGEAVRAFTSSSGRFLCDQIKVFYLVTDGGGTFNVQTSNTSITTGYADETGFTSISTDSAGGADSLGVATINKTEDNYAVKAEWVSGNVKILGFAFFNTTSRSFITYGFNVGGMAPTQAAGANDTIMASLLSELDPDVIGFMWDDGATVGDFADDLHTWITDSGIVYPLVLSYGCGPKNGADAAILAQNNTLEEKSIDYGWVHINGFEAGGSDWATLDALGWGGDGTHLSDEFYDYVATQMLWKIGFPVEYNQRTSYLYNNDAVSATVSDPAPIVARHLQVRLGDLSDRIAFNLFTDNTFGYESFIRLDRCLTIEDENGNDFWRLSVDKNQKLPAIPQYTEIGVGTGISLFSHTGDPEGVFLKDGDPGSLTLAGNGKLYVKESGTANTGWDEVYSGNDAAGTIDFASLASDASATATITVIGADTTDLVMLQPQQIGGVSLYGHVSAADTVTVTAINHSAGAIDPASTSIRAIVIKP